MKFTFKPSPNYRDGLSTGRIMGELTLGLLAVFAFSLYYYFTTFGAAYGLRAILLMITAVISAPSSTLLKMLEVILVRMISSLEPASFSSPDPMMFIP